MQTYKYEMHCHTSEVSSCSHVSAADLVRYYKEMGYSGICVTDHFIGGSVTMPGHLDWQDQVTLFLKGWEKALEEGKKIGLDVFLGWEFQFWGTHFLTYNLDAKWLYEHPDLHKMHINDYLDLVRDEGGFVVHAHPFKEAPFIPIIQLMPRRVDGVEVNNARIKDEYNRLALQYANDYNLIHSVGSDTHENGNPKLNALEFEKKPSDLEELINLLKSGQAKIHTKSAQTG